MSSVHAHETNVFPHEIPANTYTSDQAAFEESFRHSGWTHIRKRIYDAMERCEVNSARRRRWRCCGTLCWVMRRADVTDEYKLHAHYCHDRFCRPCTTARSTTIATNILDFVKNRRMRFVTLTLQSTDEPFVQLLNKLIRDQRKLRQTTLWRRCVSGGASFAEAKWNPESQRWHVHAHILVEGKYLPHSDLRDAWKNITGTSTIVDVRKVDGPKAVIGYVAKYASKAIDTETTRHPDRLDEAIMGLSGRRLCTTFGTWRGLKLNATPTAGPWVPVMPLFRLELQARAGDVVANAILATLRNTVPTELHATRVKNMHGPPPKTWSIDQFTHDHPYAAYPGKPDGNPVINTDSPRTKPRPTHRTNSMFAIGLSAFKDA